MLASKDKHKFFYDFKNDSPALLNAWNQTSGVLNKPNEGLMCGFKPIPNSAKLLNEHGKPFRRAENPPAEIGEMIHRYCPPGGLIIDPFCGTAPVAEQAMRQGKRVVLMDRDQLVMKAAKVRHQQRYTYLQRACLLPKFYTADEPFDGDQGDREIAASPEEMQWHWVEDIKMRELDDRSIPEHNMPDVPCRHPGIVIQESLLVRDDPAMEFEEVSAVIILEIFANLFDHRVGPKGPSTRVVRYLQGIQCSVTTAGT
jgi:hypothetical protein